MNTVHIENGWLKQLIVLAEAVSRGEYPTAAFQELASADCPPALAALAEAFGLMAVKVEGREVKLEQTIERLRQTTVELVQARASLQEALTQRTETYLGLLKALSLAIEAKDVYTKGHAIRVADLAMRLGHAVGLTPAEFRALEEAALLHDIGKMAFPDTLLGNLDPQLTLEQQVMVHEHPQRGVDILAPVPFLQDRLPMILHHHENWDGTGYPAGLAGQDIPLGARVLALVDAYDAMTTDRPYQEGVSREAALRRVRELSGTRFDPALADAFVELMSR